MKVNKKVKPDQKVTLWISMLSSYPKSYVIEVKSEIYVRANAIDIYNSPRSRRYVHTFISNMIDVKKFGTHIFDRQISGSR